MAEATADRIRLAMLEESTFGTAASGANYETLRITSESLRQETTTVESQEIRSDRQRTAVKRVTINTAGGFNFQYSFNSFDTLFESAFFSSDFTAPVTLTASTISMDDGDNSINDSGSGFTSFVENQWIEVSGFTGNPTANNGLFKIATKSSNAKMILSHGTVVTEAAGDSVTVDQGAYIENGTEARFFTLEREYTDLTNEIVQYLGSMFNTLGLNIVFNEIVNGTTEILGKNAVSVTSSSGTGYDAATTTDLMSAVDDVTAVFKDGTTVGNAREFSFSLENNLRTRNVIGTLGAISVGEGTITLTGVLRAFYSDKTLIDDFLNFTPRRLAVTFEDGATNKNVIEIPNVNFTSGQRVAGGQNQDIIADLNWSASLHSTELKTLRFAKFPTS